jgi:hypothetical protein
LTCGPGQLRSPKCPSSSSPLSSVTVFLPRHRRHTPQPQVQDERPRWCAQQLARPRGCSGRGRARPRRHAHGARSPTRPQRRACGLRGGVELARGSASTAFQPRPPTQGSPAWRERGLGELCMGPSRELRGGALPRPRARELCTRRHGRDAGEIFVSHLRRARTTSTPTAASGSVRRLAQFDICAAIWINGRCDA